jgi:hypothetical protein
MKKFAVPKTSTKRYMGITFESFRIKNQSYTEVVRWIQKIQDGGGIFFSLACTENMKNFRCSSTALFHTDLTFLALENI